ncbi:uracil-DNA glycosylase [Arcobacter sp. CECT 8986]|uniref:uracil-DNA glycosylase n=1 Tax=Arcobacter sp. CECT 8986 TaxID=2044507 RepID=UPI0010099054|nr:uracil-DNA glycosylase [Arcobacter sp. CECT 8986]RXJ98427.1 uracil-DNA glycosylase [Arcobacter sp. CECT 8986]
MSEKIICQKCQYYYVTWENNNPHGCKAYGFKSKIIPANVVKKSSGKECNFYNPKQR